MFQARQVMEELRREGGIWAKGVYHRIYGRDREWIHIKPWVSLDPDSAKMKCHRAVAQGFNSARVSTPSTRSRSRGPRSYPRAPSTQAAGRGRCTSIRWLMRNGSSYLRKTAQTLGLNQEEFLKDEARLLPQRFEVEGWVSEVDRLRDDVARLEGWVKGLGGVAVNAV